MDNSSYCTPSVHGSEQFKPNTTVAAVVFAENKFLLVEEKENGQTVYNQPAGHLEANENLVSACSRELYEETGLALTPDYCSGIYYFHRPELNLYFLRFCFVKTLSKIQTCTPHDNEIIACHWFTYEQIIAMKEQLRSPMVLQCIDDFLSGQKIPLSMLSSNLQ
ncbi:NUDIX hydrolase [Thalassotalea sp. 1_MG-2023]|uniref:NUDIX hydrolase n=1 Tax=Thalassotalea sp. 1_MG-2023 TaxID=3062680 RepID=UPI0026E477AA|nr:NUDIX hydrolase [Thalassotalea sp. 1_MG-2023]MDO6428209.1 NUDIX hydrolase [Thalassotalea sp. 1_MG-2023]